MSVTWHGTIDLTAWCFLSQPALLHRDWAQLLSYCLVPRLCLIFCLLSKLYSKKLVYLTFYQTWSLTVIWSQRTRVSWCVNVSKKCTLKVLRIKAWKKKSATCCIENMIKGSLSWDAPGKLFSKCELFCSFFYSKRSTMPTDSFMS